MSYGASPFDAYRQLGEYPHVTIDLLMTERTRALAGMLALVPARGPFKSLRQRQAAVPTELRARLLPVQQQGHVLVRVLLGMFSPGILNAPVAGEHLDEARNRLGLLIGRPGGPGARAPVRVAGAGLRQGA